MKTSTLRFIAVTLCITAIVAFASSSFDAVPKNTAASELVDVLAMDVFAQERVVDLLLFEDTSRGRELRHRRSRDGAQTWSAPVTIDRSGRGIVNHHRGMDPQIAAAGNTVIVLWTLPGASKWGEGTLATAVSQDGGRSWATGPNPADDTSSSGHAFLELAVDPGGAFSAFWLDSRDGAQGLRTAMSTDAGRSWTPNVSIDTGTCECCWNKATTLGPNALAVLFRDKDPRDMALAATADRGRTWTRTAAVGDFKWSIEACPHVGGALAHTTVAGASRLYALVWTGAEGREGLHFLASRDGGRVWSQPTRMGSIRAKHGDLAGWQERLTAVWDDARDGARVIRAASSSDGGTTWRAPLQLSSADRSASHPLVIWTGERFVAFWSEKGEDGRATWQTRSLSAES